MARQDRVDSAMRRQQVGSVYQTLGWTLLAFDCLIVLFVWVGFRVGSQFWLWWVLIEGGLGLFLIGMGAEMKSKAENTLAQSQPEQRAPEEERYRKAG